MVYELPPESDTSAASGPDGTIEVLATRVPGGALSWTPPLESGLARGADYVWFVRAILDEERADPDISSDWSAARFFRIAAAPSSTDVEEALRVIAAYVDTGGELEPEPQARTRLGSSSAVGRRGIAEGPDRNRSIIGLKSVGSATAAIRGEAPDPTGETYGVVGVGNSPGGAGLGGVNTSGGADLILDGSADGQTDTAVSQSGINRHSINAEVFAISNTGGGSIDLTVQGGVSAVSLVGDGSGIGNVNATTLDGIDSLSFATETEIATSGGAAVHWDNLTTVPPGLDDGDDDTTYTFGDEVVLNGDVVSIDRSAFLTTFHTLDGTDHAGEHLSLAIGVDGLGLISYYDFTNGNLKVAHCADVTCTTADEITILDSAGNVGMITSITIGVDGLGLISSYSYATDDLWVSHCNDPACTSAMSNVQTFSGDFGFSSSVAIGADGRGLISYLDAANFRLMAAHCRDTLCTNTAVATLEGVAAVSNGNIYTSIAVGIDGLGLIAFYDAGPGDLRVAHLGIGDP